MNNGFSSLMRIIIETLNYDVRSLRYCTFFITLVVYLINNLFCQILQFYTNRQLFETLPKARQD